MIYTYRCSREECMDRSTGERTIVEAELSIKEDFRALHPPCTSCGDPCDYFWVPSVPQVVLKDGPTGSWPSKGNRFKQYRQKASEAAAARQRDRYGDPKKAIPNYKGQEVESWQAAKSDAIRDRGLEAAPSYDAKIAEVNKDKIII